MVALATRRRVFANAPESFTGASVNFSHVPVLMPTRQRPTAMEMGGAMHRPAILAIAFPTGAAAIAQRQRAPTRCSLARLQMAHAYLTTTSCSATARLDFLDPFAPRSAPCV